MDKISIIVPFYNSSDTLERCMDSIVAQTYTNWELYMINDGSEDESPELVRQYEKKDVRIRLINKEHSGVSATRNYGLSIITGDYIQFVDADDYIEATMLEKMLTALKKENADVAVCNYTHPSIKNYLGDCVLDMTKPEDRLRYYQTTFAAVVPWNKLYRREVITEVFHESVHFCEDELFGMSNLHNVHKLVSLSEKLYHYYVAPISDNLEECSCIVRIARAPQFWLNHNTYWYMRDSLRPLFTDVIRKSLPKEEQDDYIYARAFDFMIWEMLIFYSLGVERHGLICEMQSIFAQPEFKKSLTIRKKYGITYIALDKAERNHRVAKYVEACLDAYDDIQENDLQVRPFYVCLQLFLTYFTNIDRARLKQSDIIAMAAMELLQNESPEAQYVNRHSMQTVRNTI